MNKISEFSPIDTLEIKRKQQEISLHKKIIPHDEKN